MDTQRLRQSAEYWLAIADTEGWSQDDTIRQLATLALEAAAVLEQQATLAPPAPAPEEALVVNEYQLQGGGPFDQYDFTLRRMPQRKGPDKWAVYRNGSALNKEGEWEYEPMPSSRDDAYFARCRYDSMEEALRHWREARRPAPPAGVRVSAPGP